MTTTIQKGRKSTADHTSTLKVGDQAPNFELQSHLGTTVKLEDLRGKNVVLAYYPFAFTPVCSSQIPGLSEAAERFTEANTAVFALSIDSTHSNKAWAEKIGPIHIQLLSDFWPHGEVAKAYGVLNATAGRAERAVFVIDGEGIVRYIDVHDIGEEPEIEQIFEVLAEL